MSHELASAALTIARPLSSAANASPIGGLTQQRKALRAAVIELLRQIAAKGEVKKPIRSMRELIRRYLEHQQAD